MKKIIIFLLLILIPINITAATKEEIMTYVESKQSSLCDSKTKRMFNSYKLLYERMLTERSLTSKDLDEILDKIKKAYDLISDNNICSVNDSIPSNIKKEIYNNLYSGAMIIYRSPSMDKTNNNSSIVIDNSNKKVTMYENNTELDVISLSDTTLNYVGTNKTVINIIYLSVISFILIIILYILFKKYIKKNLLLNNLTISLLISLCLVSISFILFSTKLSNYFDILSTLEYQSNTNTKELKVTDKKIVSYPSYGFNYGSLIINDININLPITFGDSKDILTKSIGHTSSSYFPGQNGTIILSGHNSKDMLYNLKNIDKKDKILIKTTYGEFTYKVTKINTIKDNTIIDVNNKKEELIIYTCYPFSNLLYGNKRFFVYSSLIESKWY